MILITFCFQSPLCKNAVLPFCNSRRYGKKSAGSSNRGDIKIQMLMYWQYILCRIRLANSMSVANVFRWVLANIPFRITKSELGNNDFKTWKDSCNPVSFLWGSVRLFIFEYFTTFPLKWENNFLTRVSSPAQALRSFVVNWKLWLFDTWHLTENKSVLVL